MLVLTKAELLDAHQPLPMSASRWPFSLGAQVFSQRLSGLVLSQRRTTPYWLEPQQAINSSLIRL